MNRSGRAIVMCLGAMLCMNPVAWADSAPATQPASEQTAESGIDLQAIELRPFFVEGRTSRYEFSNRRTQDITVSYGSERDQTTTVMEVQGELSWKVLAVRTDGSAMCSFTYDYLRMTLTMPDGSQQVIDSRQGSAEIEELLTLLQAMAGTPVEIEMGADGRPINVSSLQAIAAKMGDVPPDLIPKPEDFLQSASELATLVGAPPALAVGGQWSERFDWRHALGREKYDSQYVLKDVQEIAGIPIAVVEQSSRLTLEPDYSKFPTGGPKVSVRSLSGDAQKQFMFDLQRHETAGSHSQRQSTIEIRIALPDGNTISRMMVETIQQQILRIAEGP